VTLAKKTLKRKQWQDTGQPDRARYSHLLRHLVRKRFRPSLSICITRFRD